MLTSCLNWKHLMQFDDLHPIEKKNLVDERDLSYLYTQDDIFCYTFCEQ